MDLNDFPTVPCGVDPVTFNSLLIPYSIAAACGSWQAAMLLQAGSVLSKAVWVLEEEVTKLVGT